VSKQFEAVTIPKWGIEMTHGRIVAWRYSEGEQVAAGAELVDIETDKIVNSFEARVAGSLVKILVPEGEELPVGTLIGVLAMTDFQPQSWRHLSPSKNLPRRRSQSLRRRPKMWSRRRRWRTLPPSKLVQH
jgi:pyruvate dehydrogenase E2 component (dihydrolipoamide acetyltransferase)